MYNITNNTKILAKDKKTGIITTLLDTNYGETRKVGAVLAGIEASDAVDDSLDLFVFTVKKSFTRKLFAPFDLIEFIVNDGIKEEVRDMLVLFDNAKTYSRLEKCYTHTVNCIELIKLLEKVKIYNMKLTNPNDTLLQQFEKALMNAEPVINPHLEQGRYNRFTLSQSLKDLLGNTPGRDFSGFENTDFRTVLDEMLAPLNARATVENIYFDDNSDISRIEIGYRLMTEVKKVVPVWTMEEQGEIIGEELENDGHNYAGKIVARGYNSISQNPLEFTDTFKSNNANIKDTTAMVFFPFPISEKGFKSFKLRTKSEWYKYDPEGEDKPIYNPTEMRNITIDLTKIFIPQEQYELLDETTQRQYIPYTIGSDSMAMGRASKGLFGFTEINIKSIIEDMVRSRIFSDYKYFRGMVGNYYDNPFTISYYPIIDTVDEISKPKIYDKDELRLGIMDSQTEKTLDIERHGKKLSGLIKRTGNAEYYIDAKLKYHSKMLPVMSKIDLPDEEKDGYIDTDYVVYRREYTVYDNFINVRYFLSKDFNAVQTYAGVNREKHLFDIPLESDETPLMVKKYMVFSDEAGGDLAHQGVIKAALNTLLGVNQSGEYLFEDETRTATGQLRYLLFTARGAGNNMYPYDTENSSGAFPYRSMEYRFMRPLVGFAKDKTMTVMARTLDNYSVDYSRDGYGFSIWGDQGNKITYNRYVDREGDSIGECRSFDLSLGFEFKEPSNPTAAAEIISKFPVVKTGDFVQDSSTDSFYYYKDRGQRPLFVYSFECMPDSSNYGKIIVGTSFAKNNNLIKDNGAGLSGLRLVINTVKTLEEDADVLPPDYETSANDEVSRHFEIGTTSTGRVYLRYKDNFLINNLVKSWAIIDEEKNIYLAANGKLRNIYVSVLNFPY